MALFAFDQHKKVILESPIEESAAVDSPALVSENHHEVPLSAQGEPEAECLVKSRNTKPVDRLHAISLTFLLVFLCTGAARLVFDSVTRNYVIGRICHLVGDQQRSVDSYSAALSNKPDGLILEDRADAYTDMDDDKHARDDLLQASVLMPTKIDLYPRIASLEVRLGNNANAVKIYKELATKERMGRFIYEVDAAYGLLLLDNLSAAKILTNAMQDDSGSKQILKALLYREEGNRQGAMDELAWPKRFASVLSDSRDRGAIGKEWLCVKALLCLDNKELKESRKFIDEVKASLCDDADPSFPLVDGLEGWLLLEEGRLDECLKLTEKTLAGKSLQDDVEGLNLQAALHLIRERVYLEQKQPLKATSEHNLYKLTNCSGRLLTPTCFRMSASAGNRSN